MAGTTWNIFTPGARSKGSQVDANFDWIEGDFLPMAGGTKFSNTYDLGSASFTWRDAHIGRNLIGGSVTDFAFTTTGVNIYVGSTSALDIRKTGGLTHHLFPAGSVSQPSIGNQADLDTGVYFPTTGQMVIVSSGTSSVFIETDASFIVKQNPYFFAYQDSNSAIATSTGLTLTTHWKELEDSRGNFSDGVFLVPHNGRYGFHVNVAIAVGTTTTVLPGTGGLSINGSATVDYVLDVQNIPSGGATYYTLKVNTTLNLNQGDRVSTWINDTRSGTSLFVNVAGPGSAVNPEKNIFIGYLI